MFLGVPIVGMLTEKTNHEKRMDILSEIEYRVKIEDYLNNNLDIERVRFELDSLHVVQDSLLNVIK
jgi:hypothetical protein